MLALSVAVAAALTAVVGACTIDEGSEDEREGEGEGEGVDEDRGDDVDVIRSAAIDADSDGIDQDSDGTDGPA